MASDICGMKKWFTVLVFVLFSGSAIVSCNLLKEDDSALRVNDQKVTKKEFAIILEKEIENAKENFKRSGRELDLTTAEGKAIVEKITEDITEDIKERMVERLLVLDAAVKKNYVIDVNDINKNFETFRERMGEENFKKFLEQLKVDENYVKTDLKKQMVVQKYLEEMFKDIKIADAEIESYFKENKQKFDRPEMVKASHILVKTEEEAKGIIGELKKGADFSKIALERSIDPSAKQNKGDLDYFPRDVMDPDFEKAAFGTSVGKMSGIVKTRFGYHIIRVEDKQPAKEATIDESKENISSILTAQKKADIIKQRLDELRKSAKIEVNIKQEGETDDKSNVEEK